MRKFLQKELTFFSKGNDSKRGGRKNRQQEKQDKVESCIEMQIDKISVEIYKLM